MLSSATHDVAPNPTLPEVDEWLRLVAANPKRIEKLRAPINLALGRQERADISDLLDDHYTRMTGAPQEPRGIFPIIKDISSVASRMPIIPATQRQFRRPVYLTEAKPLSIATSTTAARPIPAVEGFISKPGCYLLSYMRFFPVVYSCGAFGPEIVKPVSGRGADVVHAWGGARNWKEPALEVDTLALVHDIFVGYNYYHWLLDWLPRFYPLKMMGVDFSRISVAFLRKATGFQRASLHRLGITDERIIELPDPNRFEGSSVKARVFVGSSLIHAAFRRTLHGGAPWAADFLRSHLIGPRKAVTPERFILDRRTTRKLHFEDRTRARLEKLGFVTVYAEDLSFEQQIELFSGAKQIIAAHGAGLANIVFCREGTAILEMFPPNYSTSAYWITAQAAGLRYACAVAVHASDEPRPHARDYDILCQDHVIEDWLGLA